MKKYKNIKTGDIWYATDKGHISYLDKNPDFKEVKPAEGKKSKTNDKQMAESEVPSAEATSGNNKNK